MAITSFADATTTDIYNGENSKAARKLPRAIWKSAQRKLTTLHSARTTQDLSLPGLSFEALKMDRPGYFSIRVNDTYRIIFKFQNGDASDVSIENYRGRKTT